MSGLWYKLWMEEAGEEDLVTTVVHITMRMNFMTKNPRPLQVHPVWCLVGYDR